MEAHVGRVHSGEPWVRQPRAAWDRHRWLQGGCFGTARFGHARNALAARAQWEGAPSLNPALLLLLPGQKLQKG